MSEVIEFCGEEFRVGEKVGMMPMMRFARVGKREQERLRSGGQQTATDAMEAMDAALTLLEQCVHPDDWDRFERVTTEHHVGQEEYMRFAGRVMSLLASRPTGRSSDSSDGPLITEPSSTVVSSSPASAVIEDLNGRGRPDLAQVVRMRQESLSA